jgi:hypothetical protein
MIASRRAAYLFYFCFWSIALAKAEKDVYAEAATMRVTLVVVAK